MLLAELRRTRENAGISQNELSRRLRRSDNYINRVELGRHSLDVVGLLHILEAMNEDPRAFFGRFVDATKGKR